MSRSRKISALALGTAVLGSVFITATPASAGPGTCKKGKDVCFYYNSDYHGARYGLGELRGGYDGLKFKGAGKETSGSGTPLKNNAASVANMNNTLAVTVFYNSWWDCRHACQHIPPNSKANLGVGMKNENASHEFYKWNIGH